MPQIEVKLPEMTPEVLDGLTELAMLSDALDQSKHIRLREMVAEGATPNEIAKAQRDINAALTWVYRSLSSVRSLHLGAMVPPVFIPDLPPAAAAKLPPMPPHGGRDN